MKEYTDVSWIGFAILFIIASLPMFIKPMRESSIFFLQVYNLLINFIIPGLLQPTCGGRAGNSNFIFAFFLSFGIGYSLLYFRKEKKDETDRVFSIISLILFSGITFLIIVQNIKYL
jgi:hypothetical protein